MSSAPPAVALSAMRNAFAYDQRLAARLRELDLPVVAINADLFPTDTASMREHGVVVRTMSGVGHFLMMEDPERFNLMLRDVLAGIGR
jgi:pimeloyl-ACP methyl ester carboxylesterase